METPGSTRTTVTGGGRQSGRSRSSSVQSHRWSRFFSLAASRHQHVLLFHCCKAPLIANRIQTTSKLSSMTTGTSIARTESQPHLGGGRSIALCVLKTKFNHYHPRRSGVCNFLPSGIQFGQRLSVLSRCIIKLYNYITAFVCL